MEAHLARARRARDQLLEQLAAEPGVRMVDVGSDDPEETTVLRVHLAPGASVPPQLPADVGGFPVRVIRANYHPEGSAT